MLHMPYRHRLPWRVRHPCCAPPTVVAKLVKILFLTPSPPDELHRIRALQILKCLSRSHEVSLLTFVRNPGDWDKLAAIREYCLTLNTVSHSLPRAFANCLIALPTRIPLRVAYQRSPAMQYQVQQLLQKEHFDLVYVKRKRMAQYVQHESGLPRILDLTDAVSLYYKRSLQTIDWLRFPLHLEEFIKIRRYEVDILRYFTRGVVCSAIDAQYLQTVARRPLETLRVVPNVVDVDFYRSHVVSTLTERPVLLFSGLMDKHVNVDAANYLVRDIFPRIRRARPDAMLYIVGPNPTRRLREFGRTEGIVVTGHVEDIREFIDRATVVLCPVRVGAGSRNKILQAMAMERPVVSTPLGAEGLDCTDNEDLLIASDPERFADQTLRVLGSRSLQRKLATKGRRLVVEKYSLESLHSHLNELFLEIGCIRE